MHLMQKKCNLKGHGDDEDSKKEEKEQESTVQEEASSTQSQEKTEVDENKTVKAMPSVRKVCT